MPLGDLFNTIFYESDIFKVPFILLFQNRKKSSTILGSLFSISIIAIVIYLFTTSNMLLKINPNVIDQTTTNSQAEVIELNHQNFEITAGVANSFGKGFSDPTIFKIQFIQIEIGFNETIDSKQITNQTIKPTKQCTPSDFADPTTFQTLGLANYTCLEDGNFTIQGGFDEKSLKAVVVMISYCNNATDGVVCQPQANITKFFSDKGLWLYYQDNIYDVSNYTIPITKNWRLQAIQCATVPRIIDLYLKKLIFINDDQFIFTNQEIQYGFMKERVEGLSDYVMVTTPLISINIFSSKNNQKTMRQYQKFGELLASIGGLINVLIILGFVLTNLENQLQMQNYIMNNLYSYSYDHKREKIQKGVWGKLKSESKLQSAAKIDHHLWDWNKDYDEMLSKDILSPLPGGEKHGGDKMKNESYADYQQHPLPPLSPLPLSKEIELMMNPISREFSSPIINMRLKESVTSRVFDDKQCDSNSIDSKVDSKQYDFKPLDSKPFDFKLMDSRRDTKSDLKPMKTEPTKSHFVLTKVDMPGILIESARKYSPSTFFPKNQVSSPTHGRILSPVLRPKDFSGAVASETKTDFPADRHFKDVDESTPVTMKISEYFKMQGKVIFKKALSEKEKLFLLSEKRFRKETDICHILEKIQEFEKFKLIMLSPDQLKLFNLLAKPLIYLESQGDQFRRKSSYIISRSMDGVGGDIKNDAKKRIAELKKYYNKMSSERQLSFIDKNLLQLIEDDIFTK